MIRRKHIKLTFLLTTVLAITLVAAGNFRQIGYWFGNAPDNSNDVKHKKKDPVQAALIREMQSLLQRFDSTNKNYDLDASFTAIDKTDSAHALINLPYIIKRKGDAIYFRFGETESIYTPELSLYIDHAAKTMVLGEPKQIIQAGMLAFNDLYDLISGEEYVLTKSEVAGRSVISMKNDTHLSCKELQVQYDPASLAIKKIYMRMPDISDNLDRDKEKLVTLVINQWKENAATPLEAGPGKYLQKQGAEWTVKPAFENYELIRQ